MMQTPKNRTISKDLTASNADLYTVPANYEANITSVVISNVVSAERKFSFDWYSAEEGVWYTLAESTPIVGNGVVQFENTLWLRKGDKLRGLANVTSSVTITIKVQEYFIPLQIQS